MLLKRLELSGFKSFAQKTVLEFPAGVVAIVGPNGSGKSNLADALRWLLGERDTKHLRGEKIENLIFSGTPQKPALGLAQASLCLNNASRWLPFDFEEVVLSRRVDRSGSSEIFLNQEQVRLRDIVELLAKGRLGAKGFTIINQGESDLFVKSSAWDRRQMIEEIIGLKEFQMKKTQSERQLGTTLINLDKIRAMLAEIEPRLRMLKRQTDKWEKREELEKELKNLEDDYFAFKFAEIKNRLSSLEPPLTALDKEIKQKQKDLENFRGELNELEKIKTQTADLLMRRSELQRSLGHWEAKMEMLNSENGSAIEYRKSDLVDLLQEVKKSLESCRYFEELEKIKSALKNLLVRIADFFDGKKEKNEAQENYLKAKTEKETKLEELKVLNEDLSRLAQNEKKLIENFKSFEEKRETIARLENEKNEFSLEKEKLNLKWQDLEDQLRQIGQTGQEFNKTASEQKISLSQLAETEKQIFKLRNQLSGIGEIDPMIIKETKETAERHQFLSQQSSDLEKAAADLKTLIKDLGVKIHSDFKESLKLINEEFTNYFRLMFGGGKAKLKLQKQETVKEETENEDNEKTTINNNEKENETAEEDAGLEIELSLPRRRISNLEMLSGGERSLVSLAALFALVSVNPPPFLVLDEVDSALDDRNAQRFGELIKRFSQKTQFVVITHNRATMAAADVLYGITMGEDGISRVLSLKLTA